jgi:hypothetical protein
MRMGGDGNITRPLFSNLEPTKYFELLTSITDVIAKKKVVAPNALPGSESLLLAAMQQALGYKLGMILSKLMDVIGNYH